MRSCTSANGEDVANGEIVGLAVALDVAPEGDTVAVGVGVGVTAGEGDPRVSAFEQPATTVKATKRKRGTCLKKSVFML